MTTTTLLALLLLPGQAAVETIPDLNPQAPATQQASAEGLSIADVAAVLQPGVYQADVLELDFPDWFKQTSQKMQQAIAANPQKLQAAMATVPQGQPIPYAEWMGVTREEYDRITALANGGRSPAFYKTIATVPLTIRRDGNLVELTSVDGSPLEKASIDVVLDRVTYAPFDTPLFLQQAGSGVIPDNVPLAGAKTRRWAYMFTPEGVDPSNPNPPPEMVQRLQAALSQLAAGQTITTVSAELNVAKLPADAPTNPGRVMVWAEARGLGGGRQSGALYTLVFTPNPQ